MRVSTVALCTLALLATEEWSSTAIAIPVDSPFSDPPSANTQAVTPESEESVSVASLPVAETTASESAPSGLSQNKVSILAERWPQAVPTVSPPEFSEATPGTTELNQDTFTPTAQAPPGGTPAIPIATSETLSPISPGEPAVSMSIAPPEFISASEAVQSASNPSAIPVHSASSSMVTTTVLEAPPEPIPQTLSEAIAQLPASESDLLTEDGAPITVSPPQGLPSPEAIQELQDRLRTLGTPPEEFGDVYEGSPAITIAVPSGYGADDGIGFVGFNFQPNVRGSDEADATMNVGVGLGDADEAVGVQLSYTLASFGRNRDFGTGGFNAKVHRRLGDGWSIAAGWEGFLTIGDGPIDFEDSIYGAVTYVARTSPELDDPFSRVALTAGLGSGRFRTIEAIEDDDSTIGVFGSAAVRIARPVSAIVEWTGQDLALGLSIAPFRDFPLVITPALRDVAGAGDNPRFVLGAGVSFRF